MPTEHSIPIVILQLAPEAVSQALTHLVTWCVQESYAFLHTCYGEGHTEIEIRRPQQPVLVRLVLHSIPSAASAPEAVLLPAVEALPAEGAALVQGLLQVCRAS
jgi:hypothetical protein